MSPCCSGLRDIFTFDGRGGWVRHTCDSVDVKLPDIRTLNTEIGQIQEF